MHLQSIFTNSFWSLVALKPNICLQISKKSFDLREQAQEALKMRLDLDT